jgi:beta-lactamase superfamily II metal-dependent hydrolase
MVSRFIICLFYCGGAVLAVSGSTLEVCFFDTGQGNLIAVRANDVNTQNPEEVTSRLIFIDCGCTAINAAITQMHMNELRNNTPMKQKLVELFKNISEYGILITHNHADHTNLKKIIINIGKEKRRGGGAECKWYVGPISRRFYAHCPYTDVQGKEITKDMALEEDWTKFCAKIPEIENSLGPRVRVVPMRPERWKDNKAQNPEHDFNVMYLVEFAGRRILFPGDVSPQLFTQIEAIPKYGREMAEVDFWVLPHHGTNRAGELQSYYKVNTEMCIICSNPKEANYLPWEDVQSLPFKRRSNGITINKHKISTNAGTHADALLPLFVTCNASEGYYELVIEADGKATMYDGARRKSNLCFQSL